jgi:hypothetical protein
VEHLSALRGPNWQADARCRDRYELFFPERQPAGPPDTPAYKAEDERLAGILKDARKLCAGCPVREACLAYAIETKVETGIWAGVVFKPATAEKLKRGRDAA